MLELLKKTQSSVGPAYLIVLVVFCWMHMAPYYHELYPKNALRIVALIAHANPDCLAQNSEYLIDFATKGVKQMSEREKIKIKAHSKKIVSM